jgi:LuxR family maltose regulon positive regulatory protein
MAAIRAEGGDLQEAERLAQTAAGVAERHDLADHWATTLARVVEGDALEQRGAVSEAGASIGRGVELSRRGVASLETAYALVAQAQVTHLQGDVEAARDLLGEARRSVERCADPGILPEMVARAERRMRAARRSDETPADLSDRELAVLRLLPSELSQREIGDALYVSLNTVKSHVRNIYRKLDAATRDEAIGRARELQLL